jgi:ATP-dependent DNA helicase PIF1
MVGSAQFFAVSERLELVARTLWRRRHRRNRLGPDGRLEGEPATFGGFGGVGVIIVGDFAQIPPIGDSSLITAVKGQHQKASAGQRLFRTFRQVIRLRRVYRQRGKSAYKDSTLRLRDGAMTMSDHELWSSHELGSPGLEDSLRTTFEDEALWLVTENKKAGERNGQKLVSLATATSSPVVAFDAEHNDARAAKRPPEEFYQLRTRVHLAVGAHVMLIANQVWDARTVPVGLMNGARGIVRAIVCSERPPALPDYVIVEFPAYKGFPFWEDHPTWVPIPPIARQSKAKPQFERTQLPLRLSWALTVHKAQGLTCPQGIVADLSSSSQARVPAASPGIAFVAFTRVTEWIRMGFRGLPAFGDFLAVRASKLFQAREKSEFDFDILHEKTLQEWMGWTPEEEVQRHLEYSRAAAAACNDAYSAEDEGDIRMMLSLRGVRPLPDDVVTWAATVLQKKKVSYAEVVASFRGKKMRVTYGLRAAGAKLFGKGHLDRRGDKQDVSLDPALGMLLEMGFDLPLATWALSQGRSVAGALDVLWPTTCHGREDTSCLTSSAKFSSLAPASSEHEYARRARQELGIAVEIVDLGVVAGQAPKTNACMWLSIIAGASRALGPHHEAADGELWSYLMEDLAAVRATDANDLRQCARTVPRLDAVGAAAAFLRNYMCDKMSAPEGIARWQPWFANLAGRVNSPGGGGVTVAEYLAHVAGLRSDVFADQLNLVQVAEAFNVCVQIISKTPPGAQRPWAITTINPGAAERTIILGNDDLHYVWLRPTGL